MVASEFEKYNVNGLRIVLLVGSNEYDQERRHLFGEDEQKRTADIVVATPGRLIDHLLDCNNRLSLDRLR
jgi:superfamily II DNA/RNA helicase